LGAFFMRGLVEYGLTLVENKSPLKNYG